MSGPSVFSGQPSPKHGRQNKGTAIKSPRGQSPYCSTESFQRIQKEACKLGHEIVPTWLSRMFTLVIIEFVMWNYLFHVCLSPWAVNFTRVHLVSFTSTYESAWYTVQLNTYLMIDIIILIDNDDDNEWNKCMDLLQPLGIGINKTLPSPLCRDQPSESSDALVPHPSPTRASFPICRAGS